MPCFKLLKVARSVCLFLFFFFSEGYTARTQAHLGTIPDSKIGFLANFPHIWPRLEVAHSAHEGQLCRRQEGPFPPRGEGRAGIRLKPGAGEAVSGTAEEVRDATVSSWPCCLSLWSVLMYITWKAGRGPPRHNSASLCKTTA